MAKFASADVPTRKLPWKYPEDLKKVIGTRYEGNRLILTLECGHDVEWQSDPMTVPPVYVCTHRC